MSTFHSRLKELKESSDLTQAKIAEQLGITPQAFSYIVNGREPNYDMLTKIALLFNVSIDWLLGLTDIKSVDVDARVVEAYVGLSDKSIKYLHGLMSAPINEGGEYLSFINRVIENSSFQLMMHNLFSLESSVMGAALYWKLWEAAFPGEPHVANSEEQKKSEEQFSSSLEKILKGTQYPPRILESLKIQMEIFNPNEHIAGALIGAEGFEMSDIDEYRASKHLTDLIENISENAEKQIALQKGNC